MAKRSNDPTRRAIIRLPVSQIQRFECGTIGPRPHPSPITRELLYLPAIHNQDERTAPHSQAPQSLTDRLYRLMSSDTNDDEQAFESIVNWQQHPPHALPRNEQQKFKCMFLLDPSTENSVRGRQYPILADETDLIHDPNACTVVNKWAFADLVSIERAKYLTESAQRPSAPPRRSKPNKNIRICLRKRPLTAFEQTVLKEVDIISTLDAQTVLLHIPSITVDNQVFIKNRKFKCDQTFDEHCPVNTIYHSTLSPLLNRALDGHK